MQSAIHAESNACVWVVWISRTIWKVIILPRDLEFELPENKWKVLDVLTTFGRSISIEEAFERRRRKLAIEMCNRSLSDSFPYRLFWSLKTLCEPTLSSPKRSEKSTFLMTLWKVDWDESRGVRRSTMIYWKSRYLLLAFRNPDKNLIVDDFVPVEKLRWVQSLLRWIRSSWGLLR